MTGDLWEDRGDGVTAVIISVLADSKPAGCASHREPCGDCGRDVWIADEHAAHGRHPGGYRVACLECAAKSMPLSAHPKMLPYQRETLRAAGYTDAQIDHAFNVATAIIKNT